MAHPVANNDYAFTPEDLQVLIAAYEGALRELNLTHREDPLTLIIAERVMELAKKGERDPTRLRNLTMRSIRGRP